LIEENRKTLSIETFQRNKAHSDFEDRVQQHNSAISAIDESVSLLQGIANSGSLAQIKRLETTVDRIEARIGTKGTYAPLMSNIVELMSKQNFSDQQMLQ
jgi:ACT domain-containing protein